MFACIEWDAPKIDNGSKVIQYYIELASSAKKEGKQHYTQVGVTNAHSFVLRDLTPGSRYAVRIQCDNKYGMSNVSSVLMFTTGSSPPDQMEPPILTKQPTAKTATIRWNEPTSNGAAILGYRLEVSPIGRIYNLTSDCKTQVINKLNSNTEYSVTIVAISSAGESPTSEPLVFSTDAQLISPPSVPIFTPIRNLESDNESAVVSLEWSEANDNGAPIQK